MLRTSSLYETCRELFARYPLATTNIDQSGTVRWMILMLQDGEGARFLVLSQEHLKSRSSYSLWPWPAGEVIHIDAQGGAVADMAANAVTNGVPIPRDGTLLGWMHKGDVTALIVIYTSYTPDRPEPGWAVMPLAGTAEALWPSFTGEPLLGHWSWEHYQTGRMVSLDRLIAGAPGTVWWVDTTATLGSNCCVVARDITGKAGYRLRQGRYLDYEVLRAGKPTPALTALLADPGKIDLAPRFQEWSAMQAHR